MLKRKPDKNQFGGLHESFIKNKQLLKFAETNEVKMATTTFNQTMTVSYTGKQTSYFTKFINWCKQGPPKSNRG